MASEEESEESDTQIDTDSEFEEEEGITTDLGTSGRRHVIPAIVIDEDKGVQQEVTLEKVSIQKSPKSENKVVQSNAEPSGAEKSASMTSLADLAKSRGRLPQSLSPAEQLRTKLMLQRTESNEALTSQKNLFLRRQYLLGQGSSLPKKSVSTADLGNRFKSFMEKISETQKMLHPAPQPSQEMQAYINSSSNKPLTGALSPLSPLSSHRQLLDKENNAVNQDNRVSCHQNSIKAEEAEKNGRNIVLNDNATNGAHLNEELDFGESKEGDNLEEVDATNDSIIIIDDEGSEGKILDLMVANSNDVVETVNPQLVATTEIKTESSCSSSTELENDVKKEETLQSGLNDGLEIPQKPSFQIDGNVSLHNVTSVPSDVDDLFEILANDAIKESNADTSLSAIKDHSSTSLVGSLEKEDLSNFGTDISLADEREPRKIPAASSPREVIVISDDSNSSVEETGAAVPKNDSDISIVSPDSSLSDKFDESSIQIGVAFDGSKASNGGRTGRSVPRLASVESLGDTDSAALSSVLSLDKRALPLTPSEPPPLLLEPHLMTKKVVESTKPPSHANNIDTIEFMDSNEDDLESDLPNEISSVESKTNHFKIDTCYETTSVPSPAVDPALPKEEYIYQKIVDDTIDLTSPSPLNKIACSQPSDYLCSKNTLSSSSSSEELGSSNKPENGDEHLDSLNKTSVPVNDASSHSSSSSCKLPNKNALGINRSLSSESYEASSSLSESSKSDMKLIGGSKEALLSSPELVKIATISAGSPPTSTPDKTEANLESGKRYEGYIPRFKDHVTPLTYARDTLDIKKDNRIPTYVGRQSSSSIQNLLQSKLSTTPVKVDPQTSSVNSTPTPSSAASSEVVPEKYPALKKTEKNALNSKKKDGDVVQQLVLSKITRRNQKFGRRGSRITMSPQTSNENLLDDTKASDSVDQSTSASFSYERQISLDSSLSAMGDTPESMNRSSIRTSQVNSPKYSPFTPFENKYGRTRANTVGAMSRESKTLSLGNLPATPLTHPDQFQNLGPGPKRELFASPRITAVTGLTDSSSAVSLTTRAPQSPSSPLPVTDNASVSSTGYRFPLPVTDNASVSSVISGLDLERSAKQKSNLEAGLNLSSGFDTSLTARLAEGGSARDLRLQADSAAELAQLSDRAKEERLRELLAEQRTRDLSSSRTRVNRDEKVAEKLQEFRVRKEKVLPHSSSSRLPVESDPNDEPGLVRKHRPSQLQLDSMQVFSRPQNDRPQSVIQSPAATTPPSSAICQLSPQPNERFSAPHHQMSPAVTCQQPPNPEKSPIASAIITPPLSTSTPVTATPLTPSQISASKAASNQQPPKPVSTKKSKDKERRRSLIQVVAG